MSGITATLGTLPSTLLWRAIAHNGSVFCAVADGSATCATSVDGLSWTARTMDSNPSWFAIAAKAGVFCAVAAASSTVSTSSDGISWSEDTAPISFSNPQIAANGTIFCIVDTADVLTSADGLNWTRVSDPPAVSVFWEAMTWADGVFYVTGSAAGDSTETYVGSSADGVTWSADLVTGDSGSGVAATGDIVCASSASSDVVNVSASGGPYAEFVLPSVGAAKHLASEGVGFLGLTTSTSDAVISLDGETWETHATPGTHSWRRCASDGTIFATVGFSSNVSMAVTVDYPIPPVDLGFWTNRVRTQEII